MHRNAQKLLGDGQLSAYYVMSISLHMLVGRCRFAPLSMDSKEKTVGKNVMNQMKKEGEST